MKFFALTSVAVLSLVTLAGCGVAAEESQDAAEDQVVAAPRPMIELAQTRDESSVQAKLYKLLQTFKGDADLGIESAIESATLVMTTPPDDGVFRAVSCNTSDLEAVGPGGSGFTHISFFNCQLEGFDKVRNGGQLPSAVVQFEGPKSLQEKLFTLLEKGSKKGGFGIKRAASFPGCCDQPTSETFTLADKTSSLSCSMHGGGFTGIQSATCVFTKNDAHK